MYELLLFELLEDLVHAFLDGDALEHGAEEILSND